jgi:hypothetical protein
MLPCLPYFLAFNGFCNTFLDLLFDSIGKKELLDKNQSQKISKTK